jgi:acetyl-CoA carboxylase carboxyl transferase subunit alpha
LLHNTCRYQKFRKLGQFEEWVVRGADWKNVRSERAAASGVQTDAGTWALNEAEAAYIESSVNADEAWEHTLVEKAEWTNKPVQPPGLGRCGFMQQGVNHCSLAAKMLSKDRYCQQLLFEQYSIM